MLYFLHHHTKTYLRHWNNVCGNDAGKRAQAFKVYQENRRNQKDICPNTCLNTNVFFGPLVSGRNEKDKAVGICCQNSIQFQATF